MKLKKFIPYFLLTSAVFLRLLSYFRNRSLFYDEINLARNYAEKDYTELLGHLDYNQHAPPFFSWLVKLSSDIFGMNEYALRLFPFLAGLVSILLFYKIAKHFLSDFSLWFALLLFGFSSYLLEYGTEMKQYSTDVFFSCLLIYAALIIPLNNLKTGFFWASIGAISIWFSMPVVFILSGIGLSFSFYIYQNKSSSFFKAIKGLLSIIGIWLISFALLYQINLQYSLGSSHLEGFHNQFFLKLNNPVQTGEILIGIIRGLVGHTAVPIIFAFSCIFVACYHLFQKNRIHLILLLSPIFTCFFASFLHQYSLITRLSVFLFPILILLIGIGFSILFKKYKNITQNTNRGILLLLILLAISCTTERSALPYIWQPLVKEDSRSVLKELEGKRISNLIVTDCGKPGFIFYTKYCEPQIKINAERLIIQEEYQPIEITFKKFSDSSSVWVFDSHTFGKELELLERQITLRSEVIQKIEKTRARAIQTR